MWNTDAICCNKHAVGNLKWTVNVQEFVQLRMLPLDADMNLYMKFERSQQYQIRYGRRHDVVLFTCFDAACGYCMFLLRHAPDTVVNLVSLCIATHTASARLLFRSDYG